MTCANIQSFKGGGGRGVRVCLSPVKAFFGSNMSRPGAKAELNRLHQALRISVPAPADDEPTTREVKIQTEQPTTR